MKRGNKIHVFPEGDNWIIKQEGALKPFRIVKKAKTAVNYARKRASKENADVKPNGYIGDFWTELAVLRNSVCNLENLRLHSDLIVKNSDLIRLSESNIFESDYISASNSFRIE